jgi:hypothetical protein
MVGDFNGDGRDEVLVYTPGSGVGGKQFAMFSIAGANGEMGRSRASPYVYAVDKGDVVYRHHDDPICKHWHPNRFDRSLCNPSYFANCLNENYRLATLQ